MPSWTAFCALIITFGYTQLTRSRVAAHGNRIFTIYRLSTRLQASRMLLVGVQHPSMSPSSSSADCPATFLRHLKAVRDSDMIGRIGPRQLADRRRSTQRSGKMRSAVCGGMPHARYQQLARIPSKGVGGGLQVGKWTRKSSNEL